MLFRSRFTISTLEALALTEAAYRIGTPEGERTAFALRLYLPAGLLNWVKKVVHCKPVCKRCVSALFW